MPASSTQFGTGLIPSVNYNLHPTHTAFQQATNMLDWFPGTEITGWIASRYLKKTQVEFILQAAS